ncbi:MAG TPA: protein kinase [Gemmataceae bacterium]|nr:protein kinase [Gemmataceae bacterium]
MVGQQRGADEQAFDFTEAGSATIADPAARENYAQLPPTGQSFLDNLLKLNLLLPSDATAFLKQSADRLAECVDEETLGNALVQAGCLTSYQFQRIMAGTTHGLILGNHRVLDRLGAGSMGVVFLAEHVLLRRRAAVKVLPVDADMPAGVLERFYAEMRVLADLHHPNIVMAFDAGALPPPETGMPALHYLAVELVPGGDLEAYVVDHGPVPIPKACDWIRQAACGLQAAHDHHLIHRDVKPSNLLLAEDGQIKLVDFGLARQFCSHLTEPRALIGSIEFMAPEQSHDPSAVDGKADIYGLGATLFWLLTGQTPFPPEKSLAKALRALQDARPQRLREVLPEAPAELEVLIDKMLERDPTHRPAMPVVVMNSLMRFAAPAAPSWEVLDLENPVEPAAAAGNRLGEGWHVLIVDDDANLRRLMRSSLESLGCLCREAGDGETALTAAREYACDLMLLDLKLPGIDGYEVCTRLRERPPRPHLKVLVLSGHSRKNEVAEALARGADDFLAKPFDMQQLAAKVQYNLRLKDAQDRADLLARHLLLSNRQLEHSLQARAGDVRQAHDALLFAMAKMAESRDGETPGHFRRLQLYCRRLGEQAVTEPLWAAVVTEPFLDQVERCVPLHDIGKIGLSDALLTKAGRLDAAERALMQTHTIIGATMLNALARAFGDSLGFLGVATAIVRHHHERYDGQGYPDGLCGEAIPPAARLTAVADVYDALRRQRFHKPALSHADAVHFILEGSGEQFDPALLRAFAACHDEFGRIYKSVGD